jgi:hypothetical protein
VPQTAFRTDTIERIRRHIVSGISGPEQATDVMEALALATASALIAKHRLGKPSEMEGRLTRIANRILTVDLD